MGERRMTSHRRCDRHGAKRPRSSIAAVLLVVATLLTACASSGGASSRPAPHAGRAPAPVTLFQQLGAFNISTAAQARAAAAAGVAVDFTYGPPPTRRSDFGRQLSRLGMSVLSGRVSALVHTYQCGRLRSEGAPVMQSACQGLDGPRMSRSDLLKQVTAYARASASNPLIAGYWILDDQAGTDFGSLRQTEVQIANILHRYAPRRPTLCGVGAFIVPGGGYTFAPDLLNDLSVGACNEIGIYVYASEQAPSDVKADTSYDWSMGPLLSAVKSGLQSAGLGSVPWIGIGQAWGGVNRISGTVAVTPTAGEMAEQAAAFCQAGASAMTWYAWTLTAFKGLHSPATDNRLIQGVIEGGRACEASWTHGHLRAPAPGNNDPGTR